MTLPKISVLVVSYNTREVLARCLASIGPEAEVIVVDNHSPDDSVSHVRAHFPGVQLVPLPDNRGFSAAVNEAARRARGDAFLLLNPDAELPAGGLAAMAEALTRHP